MKTVIVILALGGIALSLVHIRRCQAVGSHEIQVLRLQQVELRRRLWDQQVHLSYLTDPKSIRQLVERSPSQSEPAGGDLALAD